jgi:hypothetical protein
VALFEAAPDEGLATLAGEQVDGQATRERPERGHARVEEHEVLALQHHPDDEEVVGLRERQERRVEIGDQEEARAAQAERQRLDRLQETLHVVDCVFPGKRKSRCTGVRLRW